MHYDEADTICGRCRATIYPQIAHECNFMICHKCSGSGNIGWRSVTVCDWCNGTGEWVNRPEDSDGEPSRL